ncbi:Tm-1-like ATP-binding domain-containing protein [Paenibacillus sp. MMO-177]|uniref:Tm-1-like ATP-binding domain-containing protein n=1 Tax=Paenibacillus sp. MMO-177 TaxID=3081289 RepID=UPI00301A77B2
MIGAFDTKEAEFFYLRDRLLDRGYGVISMNVGVMGSPDTWTPDIEADQVAEAGGVLLQELRRNGDRGLAMEAMARGAAALARELFETGRFVAAIGMGGGGGTSIVTAAMRELPLGVPKLCVSTVASGNVSPYVGTSDIVMFPSIVDIAGLNRLSRAVLARAAGALGGMLEVEAKPAEGGERPVVAATMFGNTTPCVQMCSALLEARGYETIVFHTTGTGGRTMESLIAQGYFDGVLDLTTTELADELCGGIMSAGPERLTAAARNGIPQVVSAGCIDMVNFGPEATVPERCRNRTLYRWNRDNTLMRTNADENREIGTRITERLNGATGPAAVLLPLRGLSLLGREDGPFRDTGADAELFETIKAELKTGIRLKELDTDINDPAFAAEAVETLLMLMKEREHTLHDEGEITHAGNSPQ